MDTTTPGGGLRAVLGEEFDAWKAIGGVRGVIEANVPALVFVIIYLATRNIPLAVLVPLGLAIVAILVRLIQRIDVMPALGGLFVVGISAFFAWRSGRADTYFLPGFLTNAAYAVGVTISLLIRRPIMGYVIGMLRGDIAAWRSATHSAARLTYRRYTRITWLWLAMFAGRVVVQLPFFISGNTAALGVIKIIAGPVLFCLILWATWLLVRSLPPASTYLEASASAADSPSESCTEAGRGRK